MTSEKELLNKAGSREGKFLKKSKEMDKKLAKNVMGDKPKK